MEYVLLAGVLGAVGLAVYWVWRGANAEAREEAFKGQNKALEDQIAKLNQALLDELAQGTREDRLRAEELVRNGDAAGLKRMLRDAQGRNSN